MCSNLDPFETEGSVAPPLYTLRIDYISLELAYGASLDGSLREAPKLRASPFMSFRATSGTLLFTLAQRTLDFSDIVADGLAQLDALAMLAEQMTSGDKDVMRRTMVRTGRGLRVRANWRVLKSEWLDFSAGATRQGARGRVGSRCRSVTRGPRHKRAA